MTNTKGVVKEPCLLVPSRQSSDASGQFGLDFQVPKSFELNLKLLSFSSMDTQVCPYTDLQTALRRRRDRRGRKKNREGGIYLCLSVSTSLPSLCPRRLCGNSFRRFFGEAEPILLSLLAHVRAPDNHFKIDALFLKW